MGGEERLNENLAAASVHLCECSGQGCNQEAAGMGGAPCSSTVCTVQSWMLLKKGAGMEGG